jgi:hypothetical protein
MLDIRHSQLTTLCGIKTGLGTLDSSNQSEQRLIVKFQHHKKATEIILLELASFHQKTPASFSADKGFQI